MNINQFRFLSDSNNIKYDYTGHILKRQHVHSASGMSTQTELYTYEYDSAGRHTKTKHKLNTNSEVTLHQNTYNELCQLSQKTNGGISAATETYTYNVRSWPKTITVGTLFSEELFYNDTYSGSTPQYGGNISAMTWKADSKTRGYKFTYDNFSRLIQADYMENGSASSNYYTEYTYDRMGNVLTMKRKGKQDNGAFSWIDNMTFIYTGNQVTRINDSGSTPTYNGAFNFMNGANQADEYTYDKNGNVTKDLNKYISSIQYNFLNLPTSITYSSGKSAAYIYDATGRKLQTSYKASASATAVPTDYCGNMIYENGVLKQVLVDGGYMTVTGTPFYFYYLKDHLGNNRVVVNPGGTATQINHYYPFGGLFGESTGSTGQRYKYNGKEFDRTHGLDWYDYGARHMSPDVGRFTTIDPMAEKNYNISPYAYCSNNPILYLDKNGKWGDKYTTSFIAMMTGIPMSNINYHPNIAGDHRYTITTTSIDSNGGFVVTSHHSIDKELFVMGGNRLESLGNIISSSGEIIENAGDVAIGSGLTVSLGGVPQIGGSLSIAGVGAVAIGSNLQIAGNIISSVGKLIQSKDIKSTSIQAINKLFFKGLGKITNSFLKNEIPVYGLEGNISGDKLKSAKTLFDSGMEKQFNDAFEIMNDEDEDEEK